MADEAENPIENEEELLLTEEAEQEDPAPEEEEQPETGEDEEEVLTFGDELTDDRPDDTGLVKHLREELKRARKEAAEAKRTVPQEETIEVGEKPTLASCDYDEETYERELDAWKERDRKAKDAKDATTRAAEAQQKQWEDTLTEVNQEKQALNRDDADDAFETVRAALGDTMNALLIHAVDKGNRARLIYALGQNPQRLEALAQANGAADPIRFIKEVAKLEGQLKMVKRRKAPEPDVPSRGSAPVAPAMGAIEKQVKKLEEEADKTGDRTALIAFKKKHGLIGK